MCLAHLKCGLAKSSGASGTSTAVSTHHTSITSATHLQFPLAILDAHAFKLYDVNVAAGILGYDHHLIYAFVHM